MRTAVYQNIQGEIARLFAAGKLKQKPEFLYGLMREEGVERWLDGRDAHRRISGTEVAEVLAPVLGAISPEPEHGWVPFCYEELTYGLYPDAARG